MNRLVTGPPRRHMTFGGVAIRHVQTSPVRSFNLKVVCHASSTTLDLLAGLQNNYILIYKDTTQGLTKISGSPE